MEITLDQLLHIVVFLSTIKYSSALCYGYCWYGSWYIWFAVVMVLGICCGGLGSFLRRRQLRKALRRQQAVAVVDINTTNMNADGRSYVLPPQQQGPNYPMGISAPYPQQGPNYSIGGSASYPQQGPYPYPPDGGYYAPNIFQPPPYSSVVDEKSGNLPPCYQEAIREQYSQNNQNQNLGQVNHGANLQEMETGFPQVQAGNTS